jgi:hypothetical protein
MNLGCEQSFSDHVEEIVDRFKTNLEKTYIRLAKMTDLTAEEYDRKLIENSYIGNVFSFYFGGWMAAKGITAPKSVGNSFNPTSSSP